MLMWARAPTRTGTDTLGGISAPEKVSLDDLGSIPIPELYDSKNKSSKSRLKKVSKGIQSDDVY